MPLAITCPPPASLIARVRAGSRFSAIKESKARLESESQAELCLHAIPNPYRIKMAFSDRLKSARRAAQPPLTQAALGEKLGVSAQAVSGWERGEDMPGPERLPKIAKLVGKSTDWLLGEDSPGASSVANKPDAQPTKGVNAPSGIAGLQKGNVVTIPGGVLVGDKDLPVYASSQGGKGALVVSTEPVDWVSRPEPLSRVKDGYGIIVSENSMSPEIESGDIALVHPHMPPIANRTCVFYSENADGTVSSCIKRLRKETVDAWHVRQFTPRRDYILKKSEWQKCHVTVGSYKGR